MIIGSEMQGKVTDWKEKNAGATQEALLIKPHLPRQWDHCGVSKLNMTFNPVTRVF